MGLEKFRHEKKKDDGYVNVDVINSNLRKSEFRWWFENDILPGEGPFNGINVDTTYSDITNRRIAIIDND